MKKFWKRKPKEPVWQVPEGWKILFAGTAQEMRDFIIQHPEIADRAIKIIGKQK